MPAQSRNAAVYAVAGALLVWALFFGGADSATRLAWIGGAAAVAACLLAAAAFGGRLVRPALGKWSLACVACLTALVVWQGASITWSVLPDRSWDYLNRGVAYLAFLVLGLFVAALVPHATRATAETGAPAPAEQPQWARRGFLASRTNAWLSIPMLFFMGAASHFPIFSTVAR